MNLGEYLLKHLSFCPEQWVTFPGDPTQLIHHLSAAKSNGMRWEVPSCQVWAPTTTEEFCLHLRVLRGADGRAWHLLEPLLQTWVQLGEDDDREKLNHVRRTQGCWCEPEPPHSVFPVNPTRTSAICCEHHVAQRGTPGPAARPFSHARSPPRTPTGLRGTVCCTALQIVDLHQPPQSDRGL